MAIEADPGGDPEEGKALAQQLCSRCHAVEGEPVSPVADAPPFHRLRRMWPLSHMEEALAEGIMVGHPTVQMPVFQFAPEEISDLLAYIEGIEPQRPDLEPAEIE
jgi:mono/diheme cytochrome c family protein